MASFSTADPNAYLAIGMQSGLGSPQTTAGKVRFAKYITGNEFGVVPAVVDIREGGDGLDYGVTFKQQEKVQGNLAFYLRPEIAGQFFALVPGGATWDGGSAPALHTFHTNHASHPYATIQVAHPGTSLVQYLSDIRFTGFTLEGAVGMPWKVTAPFTAITFGASSALFTPTYSETGDTFIKYHDSPSYVLDGTADTTIERIMVTMQLGAEELQAQGVSLDDIVIQNRSIDVEVTRRYQSPSMWQKVAYGAAGAVTPTTAVATGSLAVYGKIGSGTSLRSLLVNLGLLSYRNDALTALDPDGQTVRETISARALHTASAAMTIQLQNAHASAYTS